MPYRIQHAVVLGAGTMLCLWLRVGTPRAARLDAPPEVELGGADPAAADAIRASRERVRASPDSADAWGRLGMVLLAKPPGLRVVVRLDWRPMPPVRVRVHSVNRP